MINKKVLLAGFVILISFFMYIWAQNKEVMFGRSEYFGQKLPGTTPEIFAPGIVSTNKSEFNAAFSPDEKYFFFTKGETFIGSAWMSLNNFNLKIDSCCTLG